MINWRCSYGSMGVWDALTFDCFTIFFSTMAFQHIMHIYMHSAKKAFTSLCIYLCTLFHYLMFSLWHCSPGRAWNWGCAVLAGGAWPWRSPPQHLPVWFTRGKLRLVGEVSPFDSEIAHSDVERDSVEVGRARFFSGGLLFTFWKTHVYIVSWRLFSDCAYIYA